MGNPILQQAYELGVEKFIAGHPKGCNMMIDGALPVLGSSKDCNECFLWHGASLDAIEQICCNGFNPVVSSADGDQAYGGLCFSENAFMSELKSTHDNDEKENTGFRCLLFVRVLLGESFLKTATMPGATHQQILEEGGPMSDSVREN